MKSTTCALLLENLEHRHPGLTPSIAGTYCEAARVCLDRHHISPVVFDIVRAASSWKASTAWKATDAKTKRAWANETDTTEAGAYGVALAAVEATDGLVAVMRAENLTGADYYLGSHGEAVEDLERSYRLEVSGVDRGGLTALRARLAQKVRQAADGKSDLPAIAAIVGFSATAILTAAVETE